ncbi:MAG: hypothetical protein Q8N53_01105 [Longimicrobiales bacterium]|nr:hypothetical protein [Longimicrobiales bacterium]
MYTLLATPEPLLKQSHHIGMIGDWGERYTRKWYRVRRTRPTVRDWYAGIMSSTTATLVDIDLAAAAIGVQPRYYETIYQARIGIAPDLRLYIRWPTDEYRGALEEPGRAPNPTDVAGANLTAYIGSIDSKDSPIGPKVNYPGASQHSILDDFRFEMFLVRDWAPILRPYPDYFTGAGNSIYVKIILRFLLNMLTIEPIEDQATRDKLEAGQLIYKPVLHYSEYVGRGVATSAA